MLALLGLLANSGINDFLIRFLDGYFFYERLTEIWQIAFDISMVIIPLLIYWNFTRRIGKEDQLEAASVLKTFLEAEEG